MPVTEPLAYTSPNPMPVDGFAGAEDRRRQNIGSNTAETHNEKTQNKEKSEARLNALITSAEKAQAAIIAQMGKTTSPHAVSAMQGKERELVAVTRIASAMLSQLNGNGSSVNAADIATTVSSLQSDLAADDDKPDSSSAFGNAVHIASMSTDQVAATLGSQEFISHFHSQARNMQIMSDESTLLSAGAQQSANEGYENFRTAVSMAAAMYDGQKAEKTPEALLAERETAIYNREIKAGKSEEYARSIAEEDATRIGGIAVSIDAEMRKSPAHGAERVLEAFKELVQDPARQHIKESEAHFDMAVATLADGSPQNNKIIEKMTSWKELKKQANESFTTDIANAEAKLAEYTPMGGASGKDQYNGILQKLDLGFAGDAMDNERQFMARAANLHIEHEGAYKEASAQSRVIEGKLIELAEGKSNNIGRVAEMAGISERDVRQATIQSRIDLGVSIGKLAQGLFMDYRFPEQGQLSRAHP